MEKDIKKLKIAVRNDIEWGLYKKENKNIDRELLTQLLDSLEDIKKGRIKRVM